ncbi:hypothetical protein [Anaeromyxobacter terrae]|uniref:hypothetical protein n=1 Tax=Anaeromyxobacter terrae TaxID=2925406 RepID=UPI001F595EE2|nr:hypothetical protein [Anaeromyxobacter sp. SG22]
MLRLCQTAGASCGACCGLYNSHDLSREGLRAELSRRTRALARVPRTPAAFRAAAAALAEGAPTPLFPSVRICPLLGFLDAEETRVGCLAHPLATGGADLRDCGAYDVVTCDAFLCPSHAWLSEEEAALLARALAGDFHLYGLVVTDVPFLRAALAGVATRTGTQVELRHLEHAPFRAALRRLLALKEELAPGSEGLFGAFRPGNDGEPLPRRIDYDALGAAPSPYDEILTCVGADPRSGNDLESFEGEVARRLDAAAAAFPRPAGR